MLANIAAHITVADGRIDKSEIKVAEGIGMAMFKDFDYFGYREYCHYPNSLLSIEKLLEISSNFDDELKNLIHQMCVDISTADGDSSAEELAIIHDLKVSFNLEN
jgi:tellurite resistance protein